MLQSQLLSNLGIPHGFCNLFDEPAKNAFKLKQVHGSKIWNLASADKPTIAEGDGAVTHNPGITIGITTADCLPVLAASLDGKFIGGCHAGWRGLADNIVLKLLEELKNLSRAHAQDLAFAIGPSICSKHFIVQDDVLGIFKSQFKVSNVASSFHVFEDRWTADLQELCTRQLREHGVEKIENMNVCTVENKDWASYRRDKALPKLNVAWIAAKS